MNNERDETKRLVREEATRLLADFGGGDRLRTLIEREGEFDRALWQRLSELGWLSITMPEELGGLALDLEFACIIAEAAGYHLGAVPFTGSIAVLNAMARSDDAALRRDAGDWARMGKVATFACFEAPEAAIPAHPHARFADGRLTGTKTGVYAGQFADAALVFASDAAGCPVLVVAELDHEGVKRDAFTSLDNSRGYAGLSFDAVPARLLGDAQHLPDLLADLALLAASEQTGGARACLDITLEFVQQRIAFGRPIATQQAVKHGLVDIYTQVELARGASRAAHRAEGGSIGRLAAGARVAASRAYDIASQEAIQLHGAIGATWESPLHLHYRRARCLSLEWGGPPVWRSRFLQSVLEVAA